MSKRKAIELQKELEQLYNKNQLIPRIREEFMNDEKCRFVDYLRHCDIPVKFGLDVLVQMALHKRCDLPTLVGILDKHFNDAQATTDMLYKCAVANLMDWNQAMQIFIVRFTVSQDVQEELDRYQFPLPFVVQPKKIYTNKQTGYYTSEGSMLLKNNHHEDDICLDHINRLNAMQFCINQETATLVKNQWRDLDKPKDGETKDDFLRRKKAFDKYDKTAKEVIAKVTEISDVFYLTHKYDKRGRTYCQGYHVNYQGAPWNKAVIEFANKECLVD